MTDEIALDFDHSFRMAETLVAEGQLASGVVADLQEVDVIFSGTSGGGNADRWTRDALSTDEGWAPVRGLARRVLVAELGASRRRRTEGRGQEVGPAPGTTPAGSMRNKRSNCPAQTRLDCDLVNRKAAHGMPYERVTMSFEPSARVPRLPTTGCRPGGSSVSRGDGFAGGCLSLIVLLIEIPVAILLGLVLAIRGWGRAGERSGAPTMDWVPVLWLGGFTLGVLVVAVVFLCSAHPYAGAVQLLMAAIALTFTMTAWHEESERAHPSPLPTCPTRAGTPCSSSDPGTDR
ncbi:DUF6234 family protein [Streptomyces paradoxus]|uniref:DUF6234 family protein n=1 Tax=Streptomyces paradoxus TaxID=66375 RepID=UPI0036439861